MDFWFRLLATNEQLFQKCSIFGPFCGYMSKIVVRKKNDDQWEWIFKIAQNRRFAAIGHALEDMAKKQQFCAFTIGWCF